MLAAASAVLAACARPSEPQPPAPDSADPPGSARCPTEVSGYGLPTAGFADATDPAFAGGADPTHTRDSSDAIRAAVASGRPVYLPPGEYIYRGPGIDHPAPVIVGAGQGATTVSLAKDTVFVDSDQPWRRLSLIGIRFNGGVGHIRNRFVESNVRDFHVVRDCAFIGYSGCSISTNSVDHPYWKIEGNIFTASNYTTSMGIALSGLTDGSTIANNAFLTNRVHLKLAQGGNNTYIHNNDFLRYGPPENGIPRIDVWFTLSPTDTNAGGGMVITRCKFGNEHLDPIDLRILYADEGAGELIGNRWPVLDRESSNWLAGHTVSSVFVNGIGDAGQTPLIRSTTPNVVGGYYGPITLAGSDGAPIMSSRTPLRDDGQSNSFGPLLRATSSTAAMPALVVSD